MNYFKGLSEPAQHNISWISYHLFHPFVYVKYTNESLSKEEALMLLSAAISYRYMFMAVSRGYFDKDGKSKDKELINELESLPLFKEIKELSSNPFDKVINSTIEP